MVESQSAEDFARDERIKRERREFDEWRDGILTLVASQRRRPDHAFTPDANGKCVRCAWLREVHPS